MLCAAAGEKVVKIGFSSPLSGAQAQVGKDNQRGAQMAVDELNAKGIVIGGEKIKFELLPEDDQADPKAGVQVAQKLIDSGVKGVLGPYNSGVTIPASKVYNDAGIVIATTGSNPKITLQGFAYVFRVGASDSQLGGKMALYSAKELKLKRVAVIDDRTAYGQGVAEEYIKAAKANGIEIVGREFTTDKAVDFNSILTVIKAKHPDGIFYGGYSPQAGAMVKQMRALAMDTYLMGGDSICDTEMGKLGGDAIGTKVYCTQGGSMLDAQTAGKVFSTAYQKLYNLKPMTYAVSYYDGMMAIAEAMKKADSVEPKKYSPILAGIKYQGAAGIYEFDSNHDLKSSPVTVYQFKAGEPSPITSY
ncbi:MAG: branched-chain amino acid ABC transporter substrate-binding protein [Pseudomonadota bacterium]